MGCSKDALGSCMSWDVGESAGVRIPALERVEAEEVADDRDQAREDEEGQSGEGERDVEECDFLPLGRGIGRGFVSLTVVLEELACATGKRGDHVGAEGLCIPKVP